MGVNLERSIQKSIIYLQVTSVQSVIKGITLEDLDKGGHKVLLKLYHFDIRKSRIEC